MINHSQGSVRPMTSEDLAFVAEQHRHHFPNGFFARLGHRFMVEYYAAFLSSPVAPGWVAVRGDQPVGFLVGTIDPARHRQHVLRRHGRRLALLAALALLINPVLALLFVRTRARVYAAKLVVGRGNREQPGEAGNPGNVVAVLNHVAVTPEAQGAGLGTILVHRFVEEARRTECAGVVLVTASEGDAVGFYSHLGWIETGRRTTVDGLRLTTFELTLNNERNR